MPESKPQKCDLQEVLINPANALSLRAWVSKHVLQAAVPAGIAGIQVTCNKFT